MPPDICLIEDDPIMGESLSERLVLEGFGVDWCTSGGQALGRLQQKKYDAVVSDIRLPDITGDDLFRRILTDTNVVMPPTIFITGHGSIENAVDLLKLGAADYLTKPLDPRELVNKLHKICHVEQAGTAVRGSLGVSPAMQRLAGKLLLISGHRETPVLITGESGSGKEVVARRLHELSEPGTPFVAVNCASVPENLIESELFGHVKGAFTGASKDRRGVFEQANDGLLFLDEIGDMPLPMQAKLLRAIQDRAITPVGANRNIAVSFHLVCATHRDLVQMVQEGCFREDLFYRINVIQLHVPPLRERPEDVLWLAERFIAEHGAVHPAEKRQFAATAREALLAHSWPGNVRELKHTIERSCIMTPGSIIEGIDLFPAGDVMQHMDDSSLGAIREASERDHIIRALESHSWRKAETAKFLGISRKTLWQKMKQMDISLS